MPSTRLNTVVERASTSRLDLFSDRLEHGLHVRRRTGDHLQDVGGRRLPLQRLPGLVEQPRVFGRDHGLVGKALQQREFIFREGHGAVAVHDERANGTSLQAKRCAGHGAAAGRSRRRQPGPPGHRRRIIDVGNVDLTVFEIDRTRHELRGDCDMRQRDRGDDPLRAGADADRPAPALAVGDQQRDA